MLAGFAKSIALIFVGSQGFGKIAARVARMERSDIRDPRCPK